MRYPFSVPVTVLSLTIAAVGGENAAKETLKGGPPTGTVLKGKHFFWPIHANGPYVGKRQSITQCYATRPFAIVFARKVDDRLIALIKALEKVAAANANKDRETFATFVDDRQRGPGACVVVLEKDRTKADEYWVPRLKDLAKAENLRYVILGVDGFGLDPVEKNYELPREAETTVVLARLWVVKACWAFRSGELDGRATEQIASALTKLAAAKDN